MSFSDRRHVLILLAALGLASCGFAPAYWPGAPAMALRGTVEVAAPTTRDAFSFVARLEDRIGRPETVAYRLTYAITIQRFDLAENTAGSILRYNLAGQVNWTLIEVASGKVVASGRERSFTGSAATGATIAAQAAEDDARLRLMQILADQVATRLVVAAPAPEQG